MKGKEVLRLVDSLHKNKEIDKEIIFQAIESALQSAARKHFGPEKDIVIEIDRETGEIAAVRGDERMDPEMLGRIAAQAAKQVIIQKIREAESDSIYNEYVSLKGTLVTGAVKRFEDGDIIVELEKAEGALPRTEQIFGEHFQPGERIRAIILDVKRVPQRVNIVLSRATTEFLKRLFELEVPEVEEGVVEIVKISREAGLRSKVAVQSHDPRVDAIGACVGVRGTRIKSIIDELNGEKIDIIPWSEVPEIMISQTLRPAEILKITLEEGEYTKRATVTVPEDQISLAIGRRGQNVRLAVKMSGWDIDIQPPEAPAGEPAKAEGTPDQVTDVVAAGQAEGTPDQVTDVVAAGQAEAPAGETQEHQKEDGEPRTQEAPQGQ